MLALCLLLTACIEPGETLNEVGGVRATVYRHVLPVEPSQVAMPGDRLLPSACGKAAAPDGLFDPCRPDPDQPELDAYGLPRLRPAPAQEPPRLPPARPRARAVARAPVAQAPVTQAPVTPHAKPAKAAAARLARAVPRPAHKPARRPVTSRRR